jgi:hypothetical protein
LAQQGPVARVVTVRLLVLGSLADRHFHQGLVGRAVPAGRDLRRDTSDTGLVVDIARRSADLVGRDFRAGRDFHFGQPGRGVREGPESQVDIGVESAGIHIGRASHHSDASGGRCC